MGSTRHKLRQNLSCLRELFLQHSLVGQQYDLGQEGEGEGEGEGEDGVRARVRVRVKIRVVRIRVKVRVRVRVRGSGWGLVVSGWGKG